MLGRVWDEDGGWGKAKDLHDQSVRYSQNSNVTAQALALKALNSYALGDAGDALHLFQEALELFDPHRPLFNSYFYRNALLFCGGIHFDQREMEKAEGYYRRVLDSVEQHSYDFFDALTHLGRIYYAQQKFDDVVKSFERAIQTHHFSENEYLVDTWFWLARTHVKRNDPKSARPYLDKIAASEVKYDKKPQAVEMLQKIA